MNTIWDNFVMSGDEKVIALLMLLFSFTTKYLETQDVTEKSVMVSRKILDNLEPEGTATYSLPDGRALMIELTVIDAKTAELAFQRAEEEQDNEG